MTNGWIDIKNTDMMLIMGGNPAENHPCGFKWAIEAKKVRNAKMIVVDPRMTRTASVADMFLQIRAGTDIAFLGGLVNYALQNNRFAREYVINWTNAAFIVKEGFKLPDDGLYSGYDAKAMKYDNSSWNYEEGGNLTPKDATLTGVASTLTPPPKPAAAQMAPPPPPPSKWIKPPSKPAPVAKGAAAPAIAASLPPDAAYDLSLEHPRCVFQLLKKHYSRYTPEMVERITGIEKEKFNKAADLLTSIRKGGDMKKAGSIIYAVGWTQHSFGTQIIRTAAIYQMIMGNVGRAGGGVNALRGHSNIQGATDMAGIFDNLPGYLKMPIPTDADLSTYLTRTTGKTSKPKEWASFNYWSNTPKFAVSLLKSLYGDAAKPENDFCFHYLPKIAAKYSWAEMWDNMYKGKVKGLLAFGMNGVAIGPNSQKNINALKKADWLVVCDIYPEETSDFWNAPTVKREELKDIKTEVYRLPGAGFAEKDGTFVNSARWLKWKYAAVPTPGDAKLDQEILARIFVAVRALYKKEGGKFPEGPLSASWAYVNPNNPTFTEAAKEINGKALADLKDPVTGQEIKAGQQLPSFTWLKDDGTTACGNWIYTGSWTEAGAQSQRRGLEDPSGLGIYPNYAWSWPANRRVVYNRASCDIDGKPWDPDRKQVWWNDAAQKWVGNDVPDFKADSHPKEHMGPFIMTNEGVGRIFTPLGLLADGPFPEHYEPFESPVANLLHPAQSNNPVAKKFTSDMDKLATSGGDEFNIVCTTYRLTEHYHYWTKNNPVNVQLVPEPFVEIPEELAKDKGIRGGDKVKVSSARGHYFCKALVTKRIKPMQIDGKTTYQVGIPIHWGYRGLPDGRTPEDSMPANMLSPAVIDPNAYTPEFKGFLVKIEKA